MFEFIYNWLLFPTYIIGCIALTGEEVDHSIEKYINRKMDSDE